MRTLILPIMKVRTLIMGKMKVRTLIMGKMKVRTLILALSNVLEPLLIIFLRIMILNFQNHQFCILSAGLGMAWNRD